MKIMIMRAIAFCFIFVFAFKLYAVKPMSYSTLDRAIGSAKSIYIISNPKFVKFVRHTGNLYECKVVDTLKGTQVETVSVISSFNPMNTAGSDCCYLVFGFGASDSYIVDNGTLTPMPVTHTVFSESFKKLKLKEKIRTIWIERLTFLNKQAQEIREILERKERSPEYIVE